MSTLVDQARSHVNTWESPKPIHHTMWANDAADLLRQLADRVQELESTIQESLKVDAPVQPEKEERRPLHIHEIHMWARRRARALGPEGVTDPVAFLEEGVRWGEARHGIGGGEC